MGWQEEQAAARAREQQRQAEQSRMAAQRAESIRQENETRNRQQRQRANDEMFAANARRDQERQARDRAASDKGHADRMEQIRRDGQSMWSGSSTPSRPRQTSNERASNTGGTYAVKKKSKGGGWLFLFLVIGVIYALAHSGSSSSGSSSPSMERAPIVDGTTRRPVDTTPSAGTGTGDTQDTPADASTNGTQDTASSANDTSAGSAVAGQGTSSLAAPTSTALEPIDRPDAAYPAAAMATRPSGPVIVVVGVQTNGTVIRVTPDSGDPLLMPAAIEAAKQWTFRPYSYEPGASVRTMRIEFPFTPPASYTVPQNGGGANYTLPQNGGLGPS